VTQPAAIIFDLDGVLVDTEIWWDEVRRDWAAAHGRPWTEDDRASVMGANSRQWSRTMGERLALDIPAEDIERDVVAAMIERWRTLPSPLIPGADEAVRRLAPTDRLAVASSAHRDVIDAALDATGLRRYFAVVVSSDEVEHGKPAPDVYLEAARRLGAVPSACVVVEDSLNGVRAAVAAGMRVVLVPNASVPPAPGAREAADLVLDSLREFDPTSLGRRHGRAYSARGVRSGLG
jgi:HAD superfamily hydrolase (TIGR01509 family)